MVEGAAFMVAGTVIHAPKKEEKLYWCETDMERLAFYHLYTSAHQKAIPNCLRLKKMQLDTILYSP